MTAFTNREKRTGEKLMLKTGIVGGLGPESTVNYYKGIIDLWRKQTGNPAYPPIIVNSIDMTAMLALVADNKLDALADMLLRAIDDLEKAGADFAAIASNTPHVVFDRVRERSPIPLISIVDATINRAKELGIKKPLLTGTAFTMKNCFYRDCAKQNGIGLLVPNRDGQEMIHNIIFPELEEGIVIPAKKARFIELGERIIREEGADGIILGCTELPLMIGANDFAVPVLDTAQIHIDAIVEFLRH
jgi:aspartate racemase